jgi:hypothetical protein
VILTFDHEEELNVNNLNIRVVPGWKEMLGQIAPPDCF